MKIGFTIINKVSLLLNMQLFCSRLMILYCLNRKFASVALLLSTVKSNVKAPPRGFKPFPHGYKPIHIPNENIVPNISPPVYKPTRIEAHPDISPSTAFVLNIEIYTNMNFRLMLPRGQFQPGKLITLRFVASFFTFILFCSSCSSRISVL